MDMALSVAVPSEYVIQIGESQGIRDVDRLGVETCNWAPSGVHLSMSEVRRRERHSAVSRCVHSAFDVPTDSVIFQGQASCG